MPSPSFSVAESRLEDDASIRELRLMDSSYGRLVYLAGFLEPNTGKYLDRSGSAHIDHVLKRWHEQVFHLWSGYSLEQKMADVACYIAGLGPLNQIELINAWLRLTPYKNLVPASIQGPERQKHVSDFEAILGLLRNVHGVPAPHECA